MLTVTKRFRWCMAHRLGEGYPGKCKNLHGHNYVVDVTVTCKHLDKYGMVFDFGDLKKVVQSWIDERLDHTTVVQASDKELIEFLIKTKQKYHQVPFSPTVENLIGYIAMQLEARLELSMLALTNNESEDRQVRLVKLRIYETEGSWCNWEVDDGV